MQKKSRGRGRVDVIPGEQGGGGGQVDGCVPRIKNTVKMHKEVWVRVGGCDKKKSGVGGCDQRIEKKLLLKIAKKKSGVRAGGVLGGCEQRIDVIAKMQKEVGIGSHTGMHVQ